MCIFRCSTQSIRIRMRDGVIQFGLVARCNWHSVEMKMKLNLCSSVCLMMSNEVHSLREFLILHGRFCATMTGIIRWSLVWLKSFHTKQLSFYYCCNRLTWRVWRDWAHERCVCVSVRFDFVFCEIKSNLRLMRLHRLSTMVARLKSSIVKFFTDSHHRWASNSSEIPSSN